jgi:hypothetical protein
MSILFSKNNLPPDSNPDNEIVKVGENFTYYSVVCVSDAEK